MTRYAIEDNYHSFYEEAKNKTEAIKIAASYLSSSSGRIIITPLDEYGKPAV